MIWKLAILYGHFGVSLFWDNPNVYNQNQGEDSCVFSFNKW